jgi:competence protein ComEA
MMKQKEKWKRCVVWMVAFSMVMAVGAAVSAQNVEKININKASVNELMKLKQVGQAYAEKIVAYREKNGPFEKPADIMKVKGIGTKTFELNKDRIVVE